MWSYQMKNDSIILKEALDLLNEKMNPAEVERFIMLVNNQGFDYTKWRENLWEDVDSLETLSSKAQKFYERNEKAG
ncbi:conserved hypothetical protein [Desulfonatronospira thiodismutans ASO3-1]|uniref:Uncharacterized protein n=2 Tax=Desulfonatronospira thiodismutans TaxID=488939 RepID=D6SKI8_9BACT|nr:conserved hypothetical protein [Desulfonatronospira thiodismutans ASO3-1]